MAIESKERKDIIRIIAVLMQRGLFYCPLLYADVMHCNTKCPEENCPYGTIEALMKELEQT